MERDNGTERGETKGVRGRMGRKEGQSYRKTKGKRETGEGRDKETDEDK